MRNVKFQLNAVSHAEGSCLVSMGRTRVLCVATVEDAAPPHAKERGLGWVHADYAMLPRAGARRSSRAQGSTGGRAQEISRLVGRSLRAAVDLAALAPFQVTVDCDVLVADGGTRTAAINGGYVALAQALRRLHREKRISIWPVRHAVAAVSAGFTARGAVVDMDYAADKDARCDVNVVMTADGRLVEVQGAAEGGVFTRAELERLLSLSASAVRRIAAAQKKALGALPR